MASSLPRVLHLLHGLRVGGAEMLVVRLARRMRDRYRLVFACLDELGTLADQLQSEGFAVHHLHRRPGLDWRCPLRLASLMRRERIDLVHAHQYTPFFYAMAARLQHRRPPVLFTEHGRWFPDHPRWKRIAFNRLLLERRDRVVGVGEAVRQALIHNEGIPARRVGVVYNGIDVDVFASGDRTAAREVFGVGASDFVLLQVARLDHLKDHATAVRTLAAVVRERPEVRLVLVGEGPELGTIERLVTELGIADHIQLLGLRTDVPRLYAGADAFLLTSISEGIPLTLIEAMAAGLPVVSTSVGGVSEIVIEGQTGFLAPAGDPATLAEKVLRLAADRGLCKSLGAAAGRRARTVFSEAKMVAEYDRLYQEMLQWTRP